MFMVQAAHTNVNYKQMPLEILLISVMYVYIYTEVVKQELSVCIVAVVDNRSGSGGLVMYQYATAVLWD